MSIHLVSASLGLALSVAAQSCPIVADIHAGSGQSSPNELRCVLGDQLFFSATDGNGGQELWTLRNNGAPRRVSPSGAAGNFPRGFTATRDRVLYTVDASGTGRELWSTDGTAAGTALVADIRPGRASSDPGELVRIGDAVLFAADDGTNGRELWVSDGTAAGTRLLADLNQGPASSFPSDLVELDGHVLFAANDGVAGVELFRSDGTAAGTGRVIDLMPGSGGSAPGELTRHGDVVVFAARSPTSTGTELFETDGTLGGTRIVFDVNPSGHSYPREFTSAGDALFFTATTGPTGFELWIHDAQGTRLVADVRPGAANASPSSLAWADGLLFFAAADAALGIELWASDGTAAGTRLVADVHAGVSHSRPDEILAFGDQVYFVADDGSGAGLWTSDGTAAGTVRVCSIDAPRELTMCGADLYVSASTPATGRELFAVRAPGAVVQDVVAGCGPRISATRPELGQTMTLRGERGPLGFVGFLVLDDHVQDPMQLQGGCAAYVFPTFASGGLVAPSFVLPLTIPNSPSANGVSLAIEVWWLGVAPAGWLDIRPSNALLLGMGL